MIATMDISQAQAWGMLIAMIVTAITTVAGVVVSSINSLRLSRTEKKVDEVRVATDGHNDALKQVLQIEKDRGEQLKDTLRAAGIEIPAETKQTAPIPDPAPVHITEPGPMPP